MCATYLVMSSLAVFKAGMRVKSRNPIKSSLKTIKEKIWK